jgi:hypothetical protein
MASGIREVRSWLPPLNFITLHYAYLIIVTLVTSLIFWGSSNPRYSISYVDSLFLTVSAMTEAGLNTVNLSQMTTWQQVLLWLLIMLGSTIWVSIWTVVARKHVFEQRFDDIVRQDRDRRLRKRQTMKQLPILDRIRSFRKAITEPKPDGTLPATGTKLSGEDMSNGNALASLPVVRRAISAPEESMPVDGKGAQQEDVSPYGQPEPVSLLGRGHIDFEEPSRPGQSTSIYQRRQITTRRAPAIAADNESEEQPADHEFHWRNILKNGNISRNAQFHDLSSDERERLGGCEYRALKILSVIVPLYFFLWQFLGCLAIGAWIANYMPETATSNGANPWWLGAFNAVSAFNNSGMSVLDANMVPFQQSYFVLITMGLLILAGNTAYPIFLRLILWTFLKLLNLATHETTFRGRKETLEFILKYPRRVYTNLFPSLPTWWLLFMLLLTNGIDWAAFEIMNIGNPVTEAIPIGPRILDGLFQALGRFLHCCRAAFQNMRLTFLQRSARAGSTSSQSQQCT